MEIIGEGLPAGVVKNLLSKSYDKKQSSYGDYHLDKELSGQRVQVYWNSKIGKAVVVHRGTAGVQDMITDVRYTFGDKSGKRFKHSKNIQQLANEKYGADNVITLGHSLGSVLGETAVKGKDQELITLNKPVGLADIGRTVPKNQTDVKTGLDPVSFLRGTQRGNKATVINSKTYNPLTEHSTDTLDRIHEEQIIGEGLKNNIVNMYNKPKISKSELVYIPQVKQQIFGISGSGCHGTGVKYGPSTGFINKDMVSKIHISGRGSSGSGLPSPPSRRIAVGI